MTCSVTGSVPIEERETKRELDRRPGAGEEARDGQAVGAQQHRVDDEQHEREAERRRRPVNDAERAERVPAVAGDGVADQADGADRREADDPPQHLLHDLERRAVEGQERLGGFAELERGDADRDGDDEDLQDVEGQAGRGRAGRRPRCWPRAQDVARDQAGEEGPPVADARRARRRRRGVTEVWSPGCSTRPRAMPMPTAISAVIANHSRVWPARRAASVDAAQVGDAGDDRGEDQRDDERAQQRDERAADRARGCWSSQLGLPSATRADLAGDEAEDDAEHEAGEDLGGEGDVLRDVRARAGSREVDGRADRAARRSPGCQRAGQRSLEVRSRSTCRRCVSRRPRAAVPSATSVPPAVVVVVCRDGQVRHGGRCSSGAQTSSPTGVETWRCRPPPPSSCAASGSFRSAGPRPPAPSTCGCATGSCGRSVRAGAGRRASRCSRPTGAGPSPGLWDAHVHLQPWARAAVRLDLGGTPAPSRWSRSSPRTSPALPTTARRSSATGSAPPPGRGSPTVAELDAVSGERPVVLISGDAHAGWLSSRALGCSGWRRAPARSRRPSGSRPSRASTSCGAGEDAGARAARRGRGRRRGAASSASPTWSGSAGTAVAGPGRRRRPTCCGCGRRPTPTASTPCWPPGCAPATPLDGGDGPGDHGSAEGHLRRLAEHPDGVVLRAVRRHDARRGRAEPVARRADRAVPAGARRPGSRSRSTRSATPRSPPPWTPSSASGARGSLEHVQLVGASRPAALRRARRAGQRAAGAPARRPRRHRRAVAGPAGALLRAALAARRRRRPAPGLRRAGRPARPVARDGRGRAPLAATSGEPWHPGAVDHPRRGAGRQHRRAADAWRRAAPADVVLLDADPLAPAGDTAAAARRCGACASRRPVVGGRLHRTDARGAAVRRGRRTPATAPGGARELVAAPRRGTRSRNRRTSSGVASVSRWSPSRQ